MNATKQDCRRIVDMNSAIAILSRFDFWCLKRRNGDKISHECTICHGGRRVSAYRATPIDAVIGATQKLFRETQPAMRLVG